MDTSTIVVASVVVLLILAFLVWWMMSGIPDTDPGHTWKAVHMDTNWASGGDKNLSRKGLTLYQCMHHTLDNKRPGFTYHVPSQNCMLKNSFGKSTKRPNSPGYVTYIT